MNDSINQAVVKPSNRKDTQHSNHTDSERAVDVQRGNSPIVLGLPHTGLHVPTDIFEQLTPLGQTLADTDWHIERLYEQLLPDLTTVRATFHRYVIDANRDPSGDSLYPGQNTTGLVPTTDFDGNALWLSPPSAKQIEQRRVNFHAKYHAALAEQIERVRAQHGVAILFDCHSIRSVIPYLFDGVLPDFNIGTNEGATCAAVIEQQVTQLCSAAKGYTTVVNGRFKGGWTTRHYGNPLHKIHAIQLELAQTTYLQQETLPFNYDEKKAAQLRITLQNILETLTTTASAFSES